ncbi:MAG: DNA polymerase III subunit gamma/tau [Ignavibacteriae bacterium]|nr:MAG: DNA polymerase III subunit gamma/tau [Ignavibacteriota bacterium]
MAEALEFEEQEQYKVTARKWRPRVFEDVTSQEFVTKTLKNSIKNHRISHAYLFSGPRGVGKTTVARILAKSLNCLNPQPNGDPCNVCESCKEIDNDNRNHPDVFEIDGASNRNIEDVRELKEKVKYGPIRSKYKIFIIDEVHMLTGASFNALLKTLEEPPQYVVFIFATTAPERVPLTILGRCQKYDFKRLTIDEIIARINFIAGKENIKIDEESLYFVAKKGDGSMRDAQGLFDMAAAFCDNDITFGKLKVFFNLAESDVYFNITDNIKEKNAESLLKYFDELVGKGYDMQTFLDGLTNHYRNLLIAVSTNSVDMILESESIKQKYKENLSRFSQIEIINSLKLLLQAEYTFKYSSNQRTLIEALLIELIKFTDTKEISKVLDELKNLKSGSSNINLSSPTGGSYDVSGSAPVTGKKITAAPQTQETQTIYSVNTPPNINTVPSVSQPLDVQSSYNEMQNHWNSIIDLIKNEKKWVYSMLKDSSFNSDGKTKCFIKVDETRYDLLSNYHDYLAGKICGYFGLNLVLKIVKGTTSPAPASQPGSTAGETAGNMDNYEKIRSILKNELNAKEIKSDGK